MGIISGLRRLLSRDSAEKALDYQKAPIPYVVTPEAMRAAMLAVGQKMADPPVVDTLAEGPMLTATDVRQRYAAALARELPDVLQLAEADMLAKQPGVKAARHIENMIPAKPPRTRKGSSPAKKAAKKGKR